jgi:hypothetical protein
MGEHRHEEVEAFAHTFAPDRSRRRVRLPLTWLWTGLVLLVAGSLIVGMAVASAAGVLPRNGFVGIRTTATMATESAWERGNRAGAALNLLAGVGLSVVGAWLLRGRPSPQRTRLFATVGAVGFGVLALVAAFIGDRAAQ